MNLGPLWLSVKLAAITTLRARKKMCGEPLTRLTDPARTASRFAHRVPQDEPADHPKSSP